MASPQSERATLDQKPAESTPAKEDTKAETNGHASPSEAPVESEKPTVNGNGKHDGENKDTDDADTTATKEPEPSPKESPVKPDESAEEPKTVKSDDASKDEAKTDDPKDDSKVEPKEEPKAELEEAKDDAKDEKESSKPPSPKSAEPPKDVEMTDAAEEKPDDKSEITAEEKAAEASEPAKSAPDAKEDVEMGQDDEKVNGAKTEAESPALSAVAGQEVDLHPASMSQLAIDKNEEKSSAPKDADVPMADAPAPAAKVSREREEDVADEPAAKRAKTESNADSQEAPAADSTVEVKPPGDTGKNEFSFDDLPRWNDPERDPKPLTPHQIREFRKVLAGVKKTKHGAHFKEPVVKLWPGLADSYMMRIKKPMDIGELERNLRDNKYSSLRSFKDDLALVYNNSVAFNGPTNEFTKAALSVVKLAWTRVADIPVDEPAKSKPVPKPSRHSHSESRTSAPTPPVRRQPSVHAASPPAKTETEAYAVPPGGVPQVRRASTQNDLDRPKRAIQPTKNRDPDYSAKNFNKKKLPIELQFCYEVLTELMDSKNAHCNMPFLYPVDPVALAIPTYFTIIKRPMDLGTIMSKLKNYDYQTTKEFRVDVKQVFKNCYKFNGPGQPVYEQGEQLEKIFGELWSKKDQWIAKHTPAKPTSDGSARDSEDEAEEEEEEAPAAAAAPQTNKTIQMLEKRLQEETEELTNLYKTADASSDAMIDLQQSVIATIRQRILQEKQNLPQGQKPLKNAKPKPAKPTKPKASAAPTKKSAPAAPPKKSGGGGSKKAKLRNMTQPEKDAIANAINDLESPHIERAIDIIKKDTGQSENSSGELELEIDQLTNEALHKLWDLCKKALPTFAQGIAPAPSAREPSPVHSAPAKGAAKSSKPKKNKPMNAIEQEARIAELERLRHMYGKGGSDDGNERPGSSGRADEAPIHGDSESSDSEEE
ncbi:transcription regulator bdf1 [Colletotrichum karsti]|uniref:Transcription regulator bdf1 n=1 Tax=Colletotrichum karsti TaxID=1095194 RepID=A0A9P6LMF0_9PEZI|nr:transcription regulator bdf1 [Colletotrichum karsti]KAF9878146.1 transcription regulator bdf1 [Colletotrichum karsti]